MTSIFRKDHPEPVTIDEGGEVPEVPAAEPPKTDRSKQIALYAFVALFLAVIGSSVAYLASRRSSAVPVNPPVTVASKLTTPSPGPVVPAVEAPASPAAVVEAKPAPATTVAPPIVSGVNNAAAKPANPQTQVPPPVVVSQPPQQSAAAAAPMTASLAPLSPNKMERPIANRFYLQVGSLEKGVAEVLTQGLRARGIQATIAPGVSAIVSRIIVGPFENNNDMNAANKILTDLGFKPFPRRFEPEELRKLLGESAAAIPPVSRPDMRR